MTPSSSGKHQTATTNTEARHLRAASSRGLGAATSDALVAVTTFLDDLRLHDIATAIKLKPPSHLDDSAAVCRLIDSLTSAKIHKDTTPRSDWSKDEAEKSAIPVLQNILESDQYIPRHQIKKVAQQIASTFCCSPWIDSRTGYPRYKAPFHRQRPEQPSSSSQLASSSQHGDNRSPSIMCGSLADVPRSDEYIPKLNGPKEHDYFDPSDQYRDDDDPGYRIRDLWETDLVEEIQAREKQLPDAMRYPYYAAFVSTPLLNRKAPRYPQYGALGHPPNPSDSAPHELSKSSSPSRKPSSLRQGTPPRKSSMSSHSSNYVLNSTPPRSRQGSPIARAIFEGIKEGSPQPLCEVSPPSTQRCASPTFGHPSPSTGVDADDELSGAASTTLNSVFGPSIDSQLLEQRSSSSIQFESSMIPSEHPTQSIRHPNVLQPATCQIRSPKSPNFGSDEVDTSQSDRVLSSHQKSSALPSSTQPTPQGIGESKTVSLTASSEGDFPSPPTPSLAPPDPEEQDEAARETLSEARHWRNAYCDGNSEMFRQRKFQARAKESLSVFYPESGVPEFPIIDDANKVIDCFNLKVIFERNKTGFEEYKDFQVKLGSIIAGRYVIESQLGQAAFSKALRGFDTKTKQRVCMKVIRNEKDYVDQSLDEIKLLRYINCNGDVDMLHCVRLLDFFYYKEHLIIITELLRENLYEFSRKHRERGMNYFTIGRVQRVAAQILVALQYVHSLRLIHSDLKPENILMKDAENCEVKVIDFGSSCFEDDILSMYVQSRSYRAPEILLGLPYDQKIDIWSLGCILAELWTGYVLFQNDSVAALLARIVGILGQIPYYMICKGQAVSEHFTQDGQLFKVKTDDPLCPRGGKRIRILLPKPSSLKQRMRTQDAMFVDFLSQLLQIDPAKRPTATEALQHAWFEQGRYSDGLQ